MTPRSKTFLVLAAALLVLLILLFSTVSFIAPGGIPQTERRLYLILVLLASLGSLGATIWTILDKLWSSRQHWQEAEERYRQLVETSPDAIMLAGPDGKWFMVNAQGAALFGANSAIDLIGRSLLELMSPEERTRASADLARVEKEGVIRQVRHNLHRVGGEPFPAEISISLIREPGSGPARLMMVIRDISERKQIEAVLYEKIAALQIISEMNQAVTSATSLQERLYILLDHLLLQMDGDVAMIHLGNAEGKSLHLIAQQGIRHPEAWQLLKLAGNAPGWVIQHNQPLWLTDVKSDPHESLAELLQDEGIASYYGVALSLEQRSVGVLSLAMREPRELLSGDGSFLQSLAGQIAAAIEYARLFEQAQHRASEFAALYETTRDLANQQDLDALLHTIVERAARLLDAKNGAIFLYNITARELELAVASQDYPIPLGARVRIGESMAGRVALTRTPLTVDDYRRWPHRSERYADLPFTAAIQVPMLYRGELIGVLCVNETHETTRKFTQSDERLLSLFASQAASAVHNARLFHETRIRAEQLALLYDAGLTLNRVLEPQSQLDFLFKIAVKALHADRATFYRYLPDQDLIVVEYVVGYAPEIEKALKQITFHLRTSEHLVARVARDCVPIVLAEVRADPTWIPVDPEIRSGAWAPIQHENHLRGVLGVLSTRPGVFSPQDERLLVLFANQVSVAMENAELFKETRRRTEQSNVLNEMSRVLASTLDLQEIYRIPYWYIPRLVDCSAFSISRFNAQENLITTVFKVSGGHEVDITPLAPHPYMQDSPTGRSQAIARGEPVLIPDLRLADSPPTPDEQSSALLSALYVPMIVEGRVTGLLEMQSEKVEAYHQQDAELLGPAANQIGLSIHNAQLFGQIQQRAHELQLVNQISKTVNEPLTLDDVLINTLRELTSVLAVDRGAVAILADSNKHLTVVAEHNPGGGPSALGQTIPLENNPAMDLILRKQQSVVLANSQVDASLGPATADALRHVGAQSTLLVPIIVEDKVLGTIGLDSGSARRVFTDAELVLAQTIANQAAGAIERARLFEETRHRADQLTVLNRIARAVNDATNLDELLQAIHREVTATLPSDAFFIALYDAGANELDYRIQVDEGLAMHPERRPLNEGLAAMVVKTHQSLLIRDWDQEQRELPRPTLWGSMKRPRAWLGVPMQIEETVVGIINVQSYRANVYDEGDQRLLTTIADQVAVVIQKARLFEAEQTRRAELASLYELSRTLAESVDFDAILNLVVRHAVQALQVTFARITLLQGDHFVLRAAYPIHGRGDEFTVGQVERAESHPYCLKVLEQNEPIVLHNGNHPAEQGELAETFLHGAQKSILVPLRAGERAFGLLMMVQDGQNGNGNLNADKVRLAHSIGEQTASALRRAELFAELENSYLQSVLSLANAVDAKDKYTANHSERLAQMALALGKELGMSARELEELRYGSLLHDVGKIGVPDAILQKPGPLDAEEWKEMRRHPEIGDQIIRPIPRLIDAAKVVRHHHERYDGTGYPDQLAGQAIPLGARVLAVVDAYTAITDKRVYKERASHEDALAELKAHAGTQFDPNIVEVFLRICGVPFPPDAQ